MDDEKYKAEINDINSLSELNETEIKYLGRKGLINNLLKKIKEISVDRRNEYGQNINRLKNEIKRLIEIKRSELSKQKFPSFFDPSLPGKPYPKGSLHPITYTIEEIASIFQKIGFIRVSYPEVEWEYFSFEALNMPKGHPARDDFETFFIDYPTHEKFGKMLLTPHTSSGQNREMKRAGKPPIRMINIAKTYRPNWDTTHTPMFHQFEGLCVDKGINITHLKGTIDFFVKNFFGKDREIRLRPAHFQFTEPSFEIDVSCGVCAGSGVILGRSQATTPESAKRDSGQAGMTKCKVCKSGWLELAGAGMVHPNVLKIGGIDPKKYSGWAFGFGPERCMMMKEEMKINDIRILYNGDIRFLEQF